jgi:hypothetical protein
MPGPAHSLLLAFDTDAADFARGFELGRIWERLRGNPDVEVEEILHGSGTEMCMRIGEALDRPTSGEIIDETWTRVRWAASQSPAD